MKQHLGRQVGVSNVEVSLLDGKVEITPKTDGQIDPIQLLKATYDSGVSVAEMNVVAKGKIISNSDGAIALQVSDSQTFLLESNELSESLKELIDSQTTVTIRGLVYQKLPDQKKRSVPSTLKLTALEIQKKE